MLAVATLGATAAHASAKPGTFAGSLGVKVPKGAERRRPRDQPRDGRVAATRVGRQAGRFSLSLAPGTYLVVGTVVTKQGKVVQKRIGVSLKSGQKRKDAKLTARKRKRKRLEARAGVRAENGQVTPGRIAVEILGRDGIHRRSPTGTPFSGGINDMLITNVVFERARRLRHHAHRGRPPGRGAQGARVPAVAVRRPVDAA